MEVIFKTVTFFITYQRFYIVQVRDKKGCGFDEQEVILVDYPKFYNNDGYKDYWHIVGIEKFLMQLLLFFDRYGKFLKSLKYTEVGWDGTFNGEN
jgi:hypothetical protein